MCRCQVVPGHPFKSINGGPKLEFAIIVNWLVRSFSDYQLSYSSVVWLLNSDTEGPVVLCEIFVACEQALPAEVILPPGPDKRLYSSIPSPPELLVLKVMEHFPEVLEWDIYSTKAPSLYISGHPVELQGDE